MIDFFYDVSRSGFMVVWITHFLVVPFPHHRFIHTHCYCCLVIAVRVAVVCVVVVPCCCCPLLLLIIFAVIEYSM